MDEIEKLREEMKQIEIKNKETVDSLVSEKEKIETEFKEFKQKIEAEKAEALKLKRDAQWQEIKNKIPPGLTQKEEDEKVLRAQWETEPHEFMQKLPDMLQKVPPTKEDGKEHVPDVEEGLAAAGELLEMTGRSWR